MNIFYKSLSLVVQSNSFIMSQNRHTSTTDEWTSSRRMDERTYGLTNGQPDGRTDRRMEEQTDGCTNERMD